MHTNGTTKGKNHMRLNPFSRNYDDADRGPVLLEITPPRSGDRTFLGVENLLGSIAVPEPFSLELAGSADGVSVMARCIEGRVIRGQIGAHYPQAPIREVPPEEDPLRIDEGEQAWTMTLRSEGPEYVPLRTFRDRDLADPGSDPLLGVLGSLSDLEDGECVVSRMRMRSLGPEWAVHHQRLAYERPAAAPAQPPQAGTPQAGSGLGMAVLGVGAFLALQAYNWVQADETWKAVLMGLAIVAALAVIGYIKARFFKRPRLYPPSLIEEKISRIAYDADIQVTAILPAMRAEDAQRRARELLGPIAAAYRHYNNPSGASLAIGKVRPAPVLDASLAPTPRGLLGRRSIIGVREAAALWHPPAPGHDSPLVDRSGARVLMPPPRSLRSGVPVGETTVGRPKTVHLPSDTRRHHVYVARTQMGKSTLMHHVVTHRLKEKAAGRDDDAIIVVDPHADLVDALLHHVPESLIPQVRLIDLADMQGTVGINLLDTRIFTDRDRTADAVVRIARGLWQHWGPRMQSILEQTVKTLHEANAHPATAPEQQFTIIDGLTLIADDLFREGVLTRVTDPYLKEWWQREFSGWRAEYRADALAPVQTRLAYYASSMRARAILGQPRSTIDIRQTIRDGGILFVSTAQGVVGRDVAALVGASILNLVDSVIREQGGLPRDRRRGALVVVDEMQSMPGVDYESMLSELGKFGASFVLATQSLAKLDDLSPTMRDTILANVGCLAVFQTAGSDARQLVYELGRDRVSEEDIVSLAAHNCYVRAIMDDDRISTFSIRVNKTEPGDPAVADRIRDEAASYMTGEQEIDALHGETQARDEAYREIARTIRNTKAASDPAPGSKDGGKKARSNRERRRSKNPRHSRPHSKEPGPDGKQGGAAPGAGPDAGPSGAGPEHDREQAA